MDNQQQKKNNMVIVLLLVIGTISCVDSYRADFIPAMPLSGAVMTRQPPAHVFQQQQQQQGCVWSTLNNNVNKNGNTTTIYPPFLRNRANSYALDCNVRTLNVDFWSNYTFNRDQLETTSRLNVKCNDKLFFESVLDSNQNYFRLRNLQDVSLQSCKIRKIPTRVWASLGYLKSLTIQSLNAEWSSAVGMDIEMGAFEGLSNVEKLDLSQNNIWGIHDKNVFCPLRSLLKLNMSRNRLSDLEEAGFGSSSTFRLSEENGGSSSTSCVMKVQNLDLSHNLLRRLGSSRAFNRLTKLSELRLQNNLIEELEDDTFQSLGQLRFLNLSSNRLVALPPTIFKSNPTLREINLSNNSISALSEKVFSGMTTLLSLDLSGNTLTSQWITGNMFQGLKRLIILRLSFNQLSYIDQLIFKDLDNVQALHLDNNRIETINPGAFQNLKNLHSLNLANNRIGLIDSRHFSNLFVLRQLYLDHNKINEIDDDALKNCTNLQDLGIADNQLTRVPVTSGLNHLVTLDLGENRIETITNESFSGLGQLYGLRLVDNKLTEVGWGFCDPLTKLRVLNVAQNKISKISPGAFSSCPELKALRLDANSLEEIPVTLADQLPSLLWLNVSENQIKWADYKLLPPTVEWVDLSWNLLETLGTGDGGKDTIPLSLRVLDASHNRLTNLDYTSTIPPTLEILRVNHNRLTHVAPDTFIRSSRLRRVELIGNQLETIPLSSLRFPPAPSGKQLPEVYIAGNPFTCDCSMEWLTRINQLSVLRIHPRIVDFDSIVCRPTFPNNGSSLLLADVKPQEFLCPYTSHCFALCHCCEWGACDCSMRCPSNCSCFHDTAWLSNIVQCSNVAYDQVPSTIPMDVTALYLDGNTFSTLESHIFIGKKNLRILYLNGSRVETIKNKTFNGLKALEVLRLNDNELYELNGWEFADLGSLRELYLQNNHLRYISKETFSPLSFLQVLRLDGNMLSNFPVWELSGYLNSVMLADNPWSCDCAFVIPFRAWVASKTTSVVDLSLIKCQPDMPTTVGSNGTSQFYDDNNNVQQQQLIINMCDHNKELHFNNNNNENIPALLESELLDSNHISPEKVASSPSSNDYNNIPHHNNNYPSSNDISEENIEKESGSELWTIFTSVLITLIIVLFVIAFLVFRKDLHSLLPFWLYSWLNARCCYCGGDDEDNSHRRGGGGSCFFSSLFNCCCGESGEKKTRANRGGMDDTDKLFDAYFLYSRKDEDLLVQKIAPELENPTTSGYSATGTIPPPPPPHGGENPYYRLCLHYRDLCLTENPLNSDMVLSACEASRRIVLVLSPYFLQNELSHPGFRSTIHEAINRYQNKIIFIILPPFTEQNLLTIYPELKAGHFTTMTKTEGSSNSSSSSQITSLEWGDKNFWSKLKLILPTPTLLNSASSPSGLNSTSTISSTGSSAIFNMQPTYHPHHHNNLINYNNALSLHDYAYNTINSQHHQYHRNILPFNGGGHNTNPPVPKHHIALSTPLWQQQQQQQQQQQNQNFYNNSQHSQIIPIPGYPAATGVVGANTPLMVQNSYHHQPVQSFNESFRRHLHQNKTMSGPPVHHHHLSNCSGSSQGHLAPHHPHHHHHHQGSHCSSSHSSSISNNNPSILPYQPLDANYSSSGSNEELLDHVYSTLDSPPIMSNNNNGCESHSELISKQINNSGGNNCIDEQGNKTNHEQNSRVAPPSQLQQNRLNNNNTNCPADSSGTHPPPPPGTNPTNGTMYFV